MRSICVSTLLALSGSVLIGGCAPEPESIEGPRARETQLLFGRDSREEYWQLPVNDPHRRLMDESAVTLLQDIHLWDPAADANNWIRNSWTLEVQLQSEFGDLAVCAPYRGQKAAAFCSGVLVDRDLVLTAAHCFDNVSCADAIVGFGYYNANDAVAAPILGYAYRCTTVVQSRNDAGADFAFIRIDRNEDELQHAPAPVLSRSVNQGSVVSLVGSPDGVPAKVVRDGLVTADLGTIFATNLDNFKGNSGGPVLTIADGTLSVAGVMRGITGSLIPNTHYIVDPGGCITPRVAVVGEVAVATEANVAVDDLCASGYPSTTLCGTPPLGDWCSLCNVDNECRPGWVCQGGRCTPPCEWDYQCHQDHTCTGSPGQPGYCAPNIAGRRCGVGDLWEFDVCGQNVRVVEDCVNGCLNGTCVGCVRSCANKECGTDGCGGSCPNTCAANEDCVGNSCIPRPRCGDGACGGGETCASCPADCHCGVNCVCGDAPNVLNQVLVRRYLCGSSMLSDLFDDDTGWYGEFSNGQGMYLEPRATEPRSTCVSGFLNIPVVTSRTRHSSS